MSKFYRQFLERQQLGEDLTLVTVKKSLRLIEGRDYYEDLTTLLKSIHN